MNTENTAIELARAHGLQYVNLDEVSTIPESTLSLLSNEMVHRHRAIPISLSDGVVTVAIDDPEHFENMEQIRDALFPHEVTFYITSVGSMDRNLQRRYSDKILESRS